jgi:hypothetical protein
MKIPQRQVPVLLRETKIFWLMITPEKATWVFFTIVSLAISFIVADLPVAQ